MIMEFDTIFWRQCSIFGHALLLIGLLVSWLRKLVKGAHIIINRDPKYKNKNVILIFSLALLVYNLVLFCLHYYFIGWYTSDDYEVIKITLYDFAIRALAWFLVCVYLQCSCSSSKFSLLLTTWWGFYLAVFGYCLVTQMIHCGQSFNFRVFGSDILYVMSGVFFSFFFFWNSVCVKAVGEEGGLQEPLLDSDTHNDIHVSDSSQSASAQSQQAISPYSKAGFLSSLTFSWVGSLVSKGYYKKTLDLDDVPPLSLDDDASESYVIFGKCLEHAKGGAGANKVTGMQLAKSLIFMSWPNILCTFILSLINTLATYVGPYLIDSFVQYLNGVKVSRIDGYVLISAFLVAKLVESVSVKHSAFRVAIIKLRTRAVLIQSIYTKALTLSCTSKEEGRTTGELINIMSVDAERVGQFGAYLHDPWLIILQLALALLILYKTLGLASIVAFVATVLVMLAYYPVSKLFDKSNKNVMQSKDERMKVTAEILKNMRILKLQAWDMKFLSKILGLRSVENEWVKKTTGYLALTSSVFWIAPTFVSVVTFSTCMLIGVPLDSGKVLSAIATFKILQNAIIDLPNLISTITQTRVSLLRIASFLSLDELSPDAVVKLPASFRINNPVVVEISGGNFTWDHVDPHPTLKDINIKVERGMRIAICGTVGSGKSTLLSCILGEVPKVSGVLSLGGSTAYVPQIAWIQSGSIAENILFGKVMHVEKYNRVLDACSLRKDLEVLPFGDQTVIGERGINLSGGQKQRIQIARAIYHEADIYLLDDPFSAVDAQTGNHLFKDCILELLGSKTVMYVTHQVEFLRAADLILVMKEGRIQQSGTYKDILNSGTDLRELVVAHEQALSTLDSVGTSTEIASFSEDIADENASEDETDVSEADDEDLRPKGQLVQEEEREKGKVGILLYWKYITTAYRGGLVPLILMSQILFQLLQISSNYWMAWATPVSDDAKHAVDGRTLLIVYVALAVGSSFFIVVRSWLLVIAGCKTASSLFHKMHVSIFRAPMSFFDATPSGRILSRVSTDQSAVDMYTPNRVGGFAFSLISLLGVIGVMSLVVWQVYMIFIPVIAVSLWYQHYYITSARELFRLVGVNKAPVLQHFSESISGVAIIRSFGQESRFCETSTRLINGYMRPTFYSAASTQWLNFRLDLLSSLIFASTLIFLISIPVGLIDPVVAGLAVAYALNLNELQNRVISNFSVMENRIISVERVLQYTSITSEAPLVLENNRPDRSWPSCGQVHVRDLQVRYAPQLPLVLRGITCTFQGGKTTGIVGRTGCGKSTLIQALFRIVEPATGQIVIDGIDISSIGLHDLRSRLSIIPQDPTMFQGTLRSNLDPLEEYTDEQIWEALDKCQLGDEVRNREWKLDSTVSENGENWSVGQRQLFCLGRVLLKRSKVLVLDEATASVDTATDNVIQQTLREHFTNSTLIIVAHRITSVISSDQVIVLSHGVVEECDRPSRLLQNHSSSFSKLVNEYTTRSKSKKMDPRIRKQNP